MTITRFNSYKVKRLLFKIFNIEVVGNITIVNGPILIEIGKYNILIYDPNTELYKHVIPAYKFKNKHIHIFKEMSQIWH